jgi:AbrB family looped-hinge helix DNA binding protein
MIYRSLLTVPQEIREHLGLKEGDRIDFVAENGVTMIRLARAEENPFERYAGALGHSPEESPKSTLGSRNFVREMDPVKNEDGDRYQCAFGSLFILDASRYAQSFPGLTLFP